MVLKTCKTVTKGEEGLKLGLMADADFEGRPLADGHRPMADASLARGVWGHAPPEKI